MTDDLVQRLRVAAGDGRGAYELIEREAADRIEKLEAALRHIDALDIRCTIDDAGEIARRALECSQ